MKAIKIGSAVGIVSAVIIGVASGILMVHGPANAPTPQQTPAGFAQPYVAGDPATTDPTTTPVVPTTTVDTPPPPASTTTAVVVVPPATSTTPESDAAPAPTSNETYRPMPVMPTTTTNPVPFCDPDGTGATICHTN